MTEEQLIKLQEIRKAQSVRLFDVFILGPAMVLASQQAKGDILPLLMLAGGVGTIFYNGSNYIKIERAKERAKGGQNGNRNKRLGLYRG